MKKGDTVRHKRKDGHSFGTGELLRINPTVPPAKTTAKVRFFKHKSDGGRKIVDVNLDNLIEIVAD